MSRYYEMREYDCPKDYYDTLATGKTPNDLRRERADESRRSREEQEAVWAKKSGMGINE